jgi:ABC-type polysaccharide/polyol phosphate transport system ATPase subunit/SAM-dependent methyltransferase
VAAAEKPFAIRVRRLAKTFRLPHEVRRTLRAHVLHPFQRTTWEEQQALVDLSFEVAAGEFFGVVGRNGSGKSTLLKLLAGIYQPDAGTVELDGKVSPFIELGVGFQPELNARDNVRINGLLMGLSPTELHERFDEIIEFAELERFVDQKLKNYSSGMQLRLAYSIAIQVPFDILLLDEVLAVGDQNFQDKCFETFEAMRASHKTVVLVTHNLPMVTRFCDRALLLQDGQEKAIGSAEEIVEVYREQERERSAGTRTMERLRAERGEVLASGTEASGRRLSREDVALMSSEQVYELIRTQRGRLDRRTKQLKEAVDARAHVGREVTRLKWMVETLTRRQYGEIPIPPQRLRNRISPNSSEINYLAQGLAAAEAAIAVFGESPAELVLEWGCGSGRALGWLRSYPGWREWYRGCDPDAEVIAWAAEHIGGELIVCGEEPPLPYSADTFRGVLALRMMPWIHPQCHRIWYSELRRVVRPGGRILVAAQGPSQVPSANGALERALEIQGWAHGAEEMVPGAYVSQEFTRDAVDGVLVVEEYRERGYGSNDLYLLVRPEV